MGWRCRSGRDPTHLADRVSSGFWTIGKRGKSGGYRAPFLEVSRLSTTAHWGFPRPRQDAALDPASLRANCVQNFGVLVEPSRERRCEPKF